MSYMLSMVPKGEERDVEVRWEDQKRINTFSRINQELIEIKAKIDSLEKQEQDLEDAEEGIMLAEPGDDGEVDLKIMVGPTFIQVDSDSATEYVEKAKERLSSRLSSMRASMETREKEKEKIKAELYSRFGKTINLED